MNRNVYLMPILALLVVLGSCTDEDLDPIFYTLSEERSLEDDRGLENNINVQEVVRANTYSRYFAAAKTLYSRADSAGSSWSKVSPPVAGANCDTLGEFTPVNDLVYAGFYADNGDGLGLWSWDQGTTSWSGTQITAAGTLEANDQIHMIEKVNSNLFVSVGKYNSGSGTYDSYDLYYSADGTNFTDVDFNAGADLTISVPVTDIAWDGANTYWVVAGRYLYEDTDGLPMDLDLVPAGGPTNPDSHAFGGVLYSGGSFYVSSTGGQLWSYNGTWTGPESVTVSEKLVRFTRFVEDTVLGDILVGTQGTGYFRLIGGDITNWQRFQEYNISGVYNGAINSFLLDTVPATDVLFACTFGDGLWRADHSAGEWIWLQE
jgi:hypothetical protein